MSKSEIPAWILMSQKDARSIWTAGVIRMDEHKQTNGNWIGPLVTELNLVREKETVLDLDHFRAQLEDSQLPERMRKVAADINEKVGYHALDLMDFLSPQRSVLRLSFSKNRTEYILEIVLRLSGPAVVFHSVHEGSDRWNWYLYGSSGSRGSRIAFRQNFNPADITEETIQTWFSFLISRFNDKFRPRSCKKVSERREFHLSDILGKTSA